tara:strand:- start:6 stop:743 length:738 start_codon:yes stop_codon:yes gene_type:complete
MAVVTINPRIWFAQYHLSADHNQVSVTQGKEEVDNTVFTNTAKSMRGALPFVEATGEGYVEFGNNNVHEVLRSNINTADVPVTIGMEGATDQTNAVFFKANLLQYNINGVVGQLLPFSWQAKGSSTQAVQGKIFGIGSKTATANGTANQLGVLATGETMQMALHVLSVSGTSPTLDVIITSDNGSGFSSPTTRKTFAQKTAVGSEYLTLAGPIATDSWWRAQWTIGGSSTPTFDFVVVVGITTDP